MRTIKFRVYFEDFAGEDTFDAMYYDAWIVEDSLYVKLDGNGYDILSVNDPDTYIMQHTGLKDREGKGIYEGDIVEWSFMPEDGELLRQIQVVIYDQGSFKLMNPAGTTPPFDYMSDVIESPQEYRVVGNIYEHPDLLTGEGDWGCLENKENNYE